MKRLANKLMNFLSKNHQGEVLLCLWLLLVLQIDSAACSAGCCNITAGEY